MNILALDPGIKNYGYAVVSDSPVNIVETGHLKNTVTSIKENDLKNNVNLYLWEIKELLDRIKFSNERDIIIIERYQSRGVYKNMQLEMVNIMIGILLGQLYNILLVIPAVWKSFIKRRYGANKMIKLLQKPQLTSHMADAIGMAIFYIEKYCKKDKLINILQIECV